MGSVTAAAVAAGTATAAADVGTVSCRLPPAVVAETTGCKPSTAGGGFRGEAPPDVVVFRACVGGRGCVGKAREELDEVAGLPALVVAVEVAAVVVVELLAAEAICCIFPSSKFWSK